MIYCLKGYVNGELLIHQRCKNFEKSKITEGSKKSMKQKIFIILEMMLAIFVTYVVERVLPFQIIIYKVSLGWILVFVELCLFVIISCYFFKSDIKLRLKIGVPVFLFVCLIIWGGYVFLTDDFEGYNHHSSIIESPNDSRTLVVSKTGEWNGTTFCIYKKEHGMATLLYTKHSNIPFQTVTYDCKWMKNKVFISIYGGDMEYETFKIQY